MNDVRARTVGPAVALRGVMRPFGAVLAVGAIALLVMPVFSTFGEVLTRAAMTAGFDAALGQWVAPAEAQLVHGLLSLAGYGTAANGPLLSITDGVRDTTLYLSWNCVGWQTLLFLAVSLPAGLQGEHTTRSKLEVVLLGLLGIVVLNVVRVAAVGLVALHLGQLPAIVVHDYGSVIASVAFLMAFWALAYNVVLEGTVVTAPRVAFIHCGFTYSGGGERLVIEQVRGLRQRGYVVDCYAPTVDTDRCFPELMSELRPRSLFPQLPRWMPLRDAVQMLAASVLAPLLAFTLPRYDLMVGANQPGAWIASVISRIRGRPYVVYLNQPCRLVYPRDIDVETGWQTKRDYQILNAFIVRTRGFVRWADRTSVQGARELLVNGGFIGERIARVYRRTVVDCPAGARVPEGSARDGSERFTVNGVAIPERYVLLTNRHYPQKRFDLALRAIAELAKRGRRVPLVITGSFTTHTPRLLAMCDELGVRDLVLFVGEVGEADLGRLYDAAAVYVYTSPEEDFGLGLLEAMAHGVPVVAWRSGGPTVTVRDGETGYLAEPCSVGDYADRLDLLLGDPVLRRRMGAAAARHVRDAFGWPRHLELLERSFEDALRGAAPRPIAYPLSRVAVAKAR